MKHWYLIITGAVLLWSTQSGAVDGFAVAASYRQPLAVEYMWGGAPCTECGDIVRYDITGTQVSAVDTIFRGLGKYPAISFDGTRVAMFTCGLEVTRDPDGTGHVVSGSEGNPNYLAVMDIDGANFSNLVEVDHLRADNAQDANEGNAMLDWPSGDWIYYEKPSHSSEIWRINAGDPSQNELVVDYKGTASDIEFRRWDLSVDAQWSSAQFRHGGQGAENVGHNFPPPGGNVSNAESRLGLPGCNMGMSPSGDYFGHYLYSGHSNVFLYYWPHTVGWSDQQTNTTSMSDASFADNETWSGQDIVEDAGGWAEVIRWSANSDKWYCRHIAYCGNSNYGGNGSNQVIVNWVDEDALRTSGVTGIACDTYHDGWGNCAGDMWISGGPANSYEDADGQWQYVAPIDPITSSSRIPGDQSRVLSISARLTARSLVAACPGQFEIKLIDFRGRTIAQASGRDMVNISSVNLPRSPAVAVFADSDGRVVRRHTVAALQ